MSRLNQFLIYDELPLWSAPFGLTLLDTIQLRKGINILDIGSGAGFPMLEIAERAGETVTIYGIDPSDDSQRMILEKIALKCIKNAIITKGVAEELPYKDEFFGLIVANNGLNNVQDERKVLTECYRVLSADGQMVLTMNLPHTFGEFYEVFEQVLQERGMAEKVKMLNSHILSKRKPLETWKEWILLAGFSIRSVNVDGFKMRFADGKAFLEHNFIGTAFRKHWEEIAGNPEIMKVIEARLNEDSDVAGELTMSVPFVCFDCQKTGTKMV